METRRYINVRTWSKTWFEELSTADKFVWIYLNTNSSTNMLGAYSTSVRRLAYECHISEPAVRRTIKKLIYHEGYFIIIDWMAQQSMNLSMKIAAQKKKYDNIPEKIRLLLSPQTYQSIEKTRHLSGQDASPLPCPIDTPQGEKEEEEGNTEQENKEEHRISGQDKRSGYQEEDSTPIPTPKTTVMTTITHITIQQPQTNLSQQMSIPFYNQKH